MNIPFLDLKRQYESIKSEVEASVLEVMQSGVYIGGKYVTEFERSISGYLGVKHAAACGNGTDALTLALRACGVSVGDEVITSPFSFFATAEAIAETGAVPVFVDIVESDFNIDAAKIEEKITPKTKAILPVHIFGSPCDMDAINAIAKTHGLRVIEDAAQAIGSEYKGVKAGGLADIGCFSFYPTKNLGAFGDGGMVTTNDDGLAVILRALREHGMGKNGARARELLYGDKDELVLAEQSDALYNPYKYYNYLIGYNSRLDAVQAAVLSVKLKYLDGYNAARTRIAKMYTDALSGVVITPKEPVCGSACYHQYAIRTEKKDELIAYLADKGIGSGAFYPVPLHLQKAFKSLGYKRGDLPVAEKVTAETVCLPIFPELRDEEIAHVTGEIKRFLRRL